MDMPEKKTRFFFFQDCACVLHVMSNTLEIAGMYFFNKITEQYENICVIPGIFKEE